MSIICFNKSLTTYNNINVEKSKSRVLKTNKVEDKGDGSVLAKVGSFVLSDTRGQVFSISLDNNSYDSLRMASSSITAMCYLYGERNQVILAYSNNIIVVINTITKEIIGNIQLKSRYPAKIIQCHPTQNRVIISTYNNMVYLWNLSSWRCYQSLECEETVVEVKFEMNGDVIALVLSRTGCYLYSSETFQLITHLALPSSERHPTWTSYCCSSPMVIPGQNNPNVVNMILSGNNAMLYSWIVSLSIKRGESIDIRLVDCRLEHIIELPAKVREGVAIIDLQNSNLAVMTIDGSLLLLNVDRSNSFGAKKSEKWQWKCLCEVNRSMIHGNNKDELDEIKYQTLFKSDEIDLGDSVNNKNTHKYVPFYGRMDSFGSTLVIIGIDGRAKVFDYNTLIKSLNQDSIALVWRKPHNSDAKSITTSPKRIIRHKNATSSRITTSISRENKASSRMESNSVSPVRISNSSKITNAPNARAFRDLTERNLASNRPVSNSHNEEKSRSKSAPKLIQKSFSSSQDNINLNMNRTSTETTNIFVDPKTTSSFKKNRSNFDSSSTKTSQLISTNNDDGKDLISVYELAQLSPHQSQINHQKLKSYLSIHGEFPVRYRSLVWRFLLRLPENIPSYTDLVRRGIHEDYDNLQSRYPIKDEKVFSRLQNICSQLSHWAPILGQAEYLPSFAFPFVLLYENNEMAALETCMTMMMWWGFSWHATHPHPPVHITDAISNLIQINDNKLSAHCRRHLIPIGIIGWKFLSSLFTELLSRSDWLKLMDFIFCHFSTISLMLVIPVALLKEMRVSLLSSENGEHVMNYCRNQQNVNIASVIKSAQKMIKNTHPKHFAAVTTNYVNGQFELGSTLKQYDASNNNETEQIQQNLALSNGKPCYPLPKSRYPIYDGFPQKIYNMHIQERRRAIALSEEISHREEVLKQLELKLTEIESDHAAWMSRHQKATEAELKYQQSIMNQEKQHLRELVRIEEEISSQRIAALDRLEDAASEEMKILDENMLESERLLVESEKHQREKTELAVTLLKHRELAEAAELASQEKLRRLRMRRNRDEWVKNVSTAVRNKEEELRIKESIQQIKWKREDDELRLKRSIRENELKAMEERDRLAEIHEKMLMNTRLLQQEREAKILTIERSRAIRIAKEESEEALESAQRSAILLRNNDIALQAEREAQLLANETKETDKQLLATVHNIRKESASLIDAERVQLIKQAKARHDANEAILRKGWTDRTKLQSDRIIEEEKLLQVEQIRLQRARNLTEAQMMFVNDSNFNIDYRDEGDYTSMGSRGLENRSDLIDQNKQNNLSNDKNERKSHLTNKSKSITVINKELVHTNSSTATDDKSSHPKWNRLPSNIPAPASGAGIGYGVDSIALNNNNNQNINVNQSSSDSNSSAESFDNRNNNDVDEYSNDNINSSSQRLQQPVSVNHPTFDLSFEDSDNDDDDDENQALTFNTQQGAIKTATRSFNPTVNLLEESSSDEDSSPLFQTVTGRIKPSFSMSTAKMSKAIQSKSYSTAPVDLYSKSFNVTSGHNRRTTTQLEELADSTLKNLRVTRTMNSQDAKEEELRRFNDRMIHKSNKANQEASKDVSFVSSPGSPVGNNSSTWSF
eukprot:gene5019-7007_t